MNLIEIDLSKCTKCGACADVCPSTVFDMNEGGSQPARPELCIDCGHCIAICPVDAINHERLPVGEFGIAVSPSVTTEQVDMLNRVRRSIRRYRPDPLTDEQVATLLEAVRYVPTGENAQELCYLVIRDPETLQAIRERMHRTFRKFHKLFKIGLMRAILRMAMGKHETLLLLGELNQMMIKYPKGEDPYLRHAPALIVIMCKAKPTMRNLDAGIAGHQLSLVAQTMGLGTCWIGFHTVMAQSLSSMRKASKIPKGYSVLGSIVVGKPKWKYRKWCIRKPLDIQYA
jgi:nitroreductase/NAD-dependent dihydropyrimidine dehydrogenase PreA subunit